MTTKKTNWLLVTNIETGEVVRRIDVSKQSERQAEKALMGLLRNMNTDKFFVKETP